MGILVYGLATTIATLLTVCIFEHGSSCAYLILGLGAPEGTWRWKRGITRCFPSFCAYFSDIDFIPHSRLLLRVIRASTSRTPPLRSYCACLVEALLPSQFARAKGNTNSPSRNPRTDHTRLLNIVIRPLRPAAISHRPPRLPPSRAMPNEAF